MAAIDEVGVEAHGRGGLGELVRQAFASGVLAGKALGSSLVVAVAPALNGGALICLAGGAPLLAVEKEAGRGAAGVAGLAVHAAGRSFVWGMNA